MKQTPFHIGPSRYSQGGTLFVSMYQHDSTPVLLVKQPHHVDFEYVATVCLETEKPPAGHVWLKGWSENEGVITALCAAGAVTRTGRVKSTGHVQAELVRLAPEVMQCFDQLVTEMVAGVSA